MTLTKPHGNRARRSLAALLALLPCVAGAASGVLENPQPGSFASGIGLISGWHCTAKRVEIFIDAAAPMVAASGSGRGDTLAACGRVDTGFGLLMNWALLAPGPHEIRALADGTEFARATFGTVGLGTEFLTGKAALATIQEFPSPDKTSVLEWRESTQSFALREVIASVPSLVGRWNGADIENRSNCASDLNNGSHGTYAQFDVSVANGRLTIGQAGITGLNCTYEGALTGEGATRAAAGTLTCTDGKKGDFTSKEISVTPHSLTVRLAIKLTGAERCDIDAIIGAARL